MKVAWPVEQGIKTKHKQANTHSGQTDNISASQGGRKRDIDDSTLHIFGQIRLMSKSKRYYSCCSHLG